MKKKILFIVATLVLSLTLLVGAIYIYKKLNYYSLRESLNPNTVLCVNTTDLKTEDFRITWNTYNNNESSIFENGKPTDLIFKEYGKNIFLIYYKGNIISKYIQFKHNNWHGHAYSFIRSYWPRF